MVGSACVLGFVLSSLEAQTSTHIASVREGRERRERGKRDAERESERERGTAESREQSVSDKPRLSAPTETTTTRRDVVAVMEKQTTSSSSPSSYGAVKIYFP